MTNTNRYDTKGEITYIHITSKTHGHKIAIIDTKDLNKVREHCWGFIARGYVTTNIRVAHKKYQIQYLHRIVMDEPPFDVDHKNGNGLDCRKSNLRTGHTLKEAKAINNTNLKASKKNVFGCRGVTRNKRQPNGVLVRAEFAGNRFSLSSTNIYFALVALNHWRRENMPGYIPLTATEIVDWTHNIKEHLRFISQRMQPSPAQLYQLLTSA